MLFKNIVLRIRIYGLFEACKDQESILSKKNWLVAPETRRAL